MNRTSRRICALTFCFLLLWGCAKGERPFLLVQVCVQDKGGVAQLIDDLKAVAASRGMRFVDRSAETERNLKTIDYAGKERADGSPLINVSVRREDGMGVGAGNVSLPGYQVALGFSEGSDQSEARRFADDVVKRLEQHWRVETVPPGSAATPKPKPGCR